MQKRNIIVIGASAGGFDAIKQLVAGLPADLDASIFIVWHMSPDVRGVLPQVLTKVTKLPVAHAVNRELIKSGRIYIAPPDYHMLLEDGEVRTSKGPKENRFRPAVDPLFRSAATAYGTRVIGIILSGALDDGTAGLWTVKQHGGTAIVQDPADAEVPSMPENALGAVAVDYKVPVSEMAALLQELCAQPSPEKMAAMKEDERTKMEVRVSLEDEAYKRDLFKFGEISPFTCPDCHGVLTSFKEGDRERFRCHTGHAFSADSLLATLTENIEESLWVAVRSVQESVFLLNHLGDHFAEVNQPRLAAMYFKKAQEAEARATAIREAVMRHEQLSADSIRQQTEHESSDTLPPAAA